MKKTIIVLSMVMIAAMLFVSCDNNAAGASGKPTYTVTFKLNAGSGSGFDAQTVAEGETAEKPDTSPKANEKYQTFKFWSADGINEFKFDETPITDDIELEALYRDLAVGDTGPAGGIIFYDVDADNNDDTNDGLVSTSCKWRYLEAAPSDCSKTKEDGTTITKFAFGRYFLNGTATMSVENDNKSIGKGTSNTDALVEAMKNSAYKNSNTENGTLEFYAAQICDRYEYGGCVDWFLPSDAELNKMFDNLAKKGLGSFIGMEYYWSSSEDSASMAYCSKTTGYSISTSRDYDFEGYVRACRRF